MILCVVKVCPISRSAYNNHTDWWHILLLCLSVTRVQGGWVGGVGGGGWDLGGGGGGVKNIYELIIIKALKYSSQGKIHIFQCMGKIFCVEFQRFPLKFHTK